jgi:hypothetical protein
MLPYVASSEKVKDSIINLAKDTFIEITVEEGDYLNIIGMNVTLSRADKSISIHIKKFIKDLIEKRGITKKSVTPATLSLYDDDLNSPPLKNQLDFKSINSSCMHASGRGYPEILPTSTYLATKYWKATEENMVKAKRVEEYLNYDVEEHRLILRPRSFNIITAADESYAKHDDAKSRTGGCIGFEVPNGDGSYFMSVSSKQPVVAKNTCESELITNSTIGDNCEWLSQMVEQLGYRNEQTVLLQDNTSTIQITNKGGGTFKRTEHIKVRFFWLKTLIDTGEYLLKYCPTKEIIVDILTKPFVGSRFNYLLNKLIGWARSK